MKIQDLEVFIVGNPPPTFGGRYFIFVKLTTDNGITGIGEVYDAAFSAKAMKVMIEDVFESHIQGMDPFHLEKMFKNVYGRGYSQRPNPTLTAVIAGFEIAMWDIKGKALDKPIYELLGGKVHEKLRSYTYLYPKGGDAYVDTDVYYNPDVAAERAVDYLKLGFTALKFDPISFGTFDPRQPSLEMMERSEQFCKKLREVCGTKADLLLGTHGQFTTSGAIRLARRLEAYDPLWFEEPTPPEMPEEMAIVARQTTIPIATGERLSTKYEFKRVLELRAAHILQMAISRVGGLMETKKIAAMAETYYAQIAPHLYCGPVEAAANIHLAASIPNFLVLESIENFGGFYGALVKNKIKWECGYVVPCNHPGLGIELDEQLALAHPYTGNDLHLVPVFDPINLPS
ncbi:MAG: mandelate racemase/muconate lactonizing enzyme family protein [Hyphomicrobiales bacterium]